MLLSLLLFPWRRKAAAAAIFATSATAALFLLASSPFNSCGSDNSVFPNNASSSRFSCSSGCSPRDRIVFVKTHKCASSTVQNVLLRRALTRRLNVAVPLTGNYLGRYRPFHRSALWGTPWAQAGLQYHLFCLHSIFDRGEAEAVMGTREADGVAYVSIVRDPVDLFVSLWDYVGLSKMYGGVTLEQYVYQDKDSPGSKFRDRSRVSNLGRNQMLFDFGLLPRLFDNATAVGKKIAEIDSHFDLVLLADRFDESMVLLRHLLCWDEREVTYLRVNAQAEAKRSRISEEARAELRRWLQADQKLYSHFAKRFQEKVDAFGLDRMASELASLRSANAAVKERCGFEAVDSSRLAKEFRPWGKGITGYQVSREEDVEEEELSRCRHFALSEMALLDEVREEQGERARGELRRQGKEFVGYGPGDFDPAAGLVAGMPPLLPPGSDKGAVKKALERAAAMAAKAYV